MNRQQEIKRQINKFASRSVWFGVIVGLLVGLVLGFAIGYGMGDRTVVIPLTRGIEV